METLATNLRESPPGSAPTDDASLPPMEREGTPVIPSGVIRISSDLLGRYTAAKTWRAEKIEPDMLEDLRRREGEYSPEILAKLQKSGGSTVFDNITDTKCSGIESMLADLFFFSGERPFGLDPTPVPNLDAEVEQRAIARVVRTAMDSGINITDPDVSDAAQDEIDFLKRQLKREVESEARMRAEGMETLIDDQLKEGGFKEALNEFITDFATHRYAVLMGPIPMLERRLKVSGTQIGVEEELVLRTERVNPLDLYWPSTSVHPEDGDLFVRRRISDDEASELKRFPGIDHDLFDLAFRRKGESGGSSENPTLDMAEASIARKVTSSGGAEPDPQHELVYWWHKMTPKEVSLLEGVPEAALDSDRGHERVPMMGVMLNGIIIKHFENWDPRGKPQVHVASYRRQPGALAGKGGSALAKSQQEQVNVIARGLSTNIHWSSRPSWEGDQDLLVDPAVLHSAFPGFVALTKKNPSDNRRALDVIDVPNHTPALLKARNEAVTWLDEKTGVYPQSYGSPAQAGPAKTLGGYELLRQDQSKTLKRAVANMSEAVGDLVRAYWVWNMRFHKDDSVKGDMQVVSRGAVQLFMTSENLEQMKAVLELVTAPSLTAVVKPGAAAKVLSKVLRMLRVDPEEIVLSDTELDALTSGPAGGAPGEPGMLPPGPDAAPPGPAAEMPTEELPEDLGAEMAGPPMPPEKESDRIRAEADMLRAESMAEQAREKMQIERERNAMKRVELLAKLQREQRRLGAEMAGVGTPAELPAMGRTA